MPQITMIDSNRFAGTGMLSDNPSCIRLGCTNDNPNIFRLTDKSITKQNFTLAGEYTDGNARGSWIISKAADDTVGTPFIPICGACVDMPGQFSLQFKASSSDKVCSLTKDGKDRQKYTSVRPILDTLVENKYLDLD